MTAKLSICLAIATAQIGVVIPGLAADRPFAIRDVRVFDGRNVLEHETVYIANGKIAAMAADTSIIPAGVEVIDGAGKTLLPGLIDAHVHMSGAGPNAVVALEHATVWGVTTVLEMGTQLGSDWAELKQKVKAGDYPDGADFFAAGLGATAPGGFAAANNQTVASPDEAQKWVDARVAEGSDYIKLFSQDGTEHDRPVPALSLDTVGAIIKAAHARGLKVIAHTFRNYRVRSAALQGLDGFVHVSPYDYPMPDFGELLASNNIFHSTNFISYAPNYYKNKLAQDPDLAPFMPAFVIDQLKTAKPFPDSKHEYGMAALQQMHAAHVLILGSTDIGYPYAPLLHAEIEIMTKDGGLQPIEALRTVTSNPATAYGLGDRGFIRPGLNADLLLVRGDPTVDITHTRRIEAVWRLGHRIDREAFKANRLPKITPPPPGGGPGGGGIGSVFNQPAPPPPAPRQN